MMSKVVFWKKADVQSKLNALDAWHLAEAA